MPLCPARGHTKAAGRRKSGHGTRIPTRELAGIHRSDPARTARKQGAFSMGASMKSHIRYALMTAALFGSAALVVTGGAFGQSQAPTADKNNSVQPSASK